MRVGLRVNGTFHEVDVEPRALLVHVLRGLGYRSVRVGCDTATCGACTVLIDGRPAKSCNLLAVQVDGAEIVTAEHADGLLERLRKSFNAHHAAQCGYCTSGMLMAAYALLSRRERPSEDEVREHMAGVLCRCTGYQNIVRAVVEA